MESRFSLQVVCGPFWDNASCVPPTEAGHEAVFPCMTMFAGSLYNTQGEINWPLRRTLDHLMPTSKFKVPIKSQLSPKTQVLEVPNFGHNSYEHDSIVNVRTYARAWPIRLEA